MAPVQPNEAPHDGTVKSLLNYTKKDSLEENSIGIRAENELKLKEQPHNPISHDSIAKEEDSNSNSSFYTAPNSPEREIQESEPGQITEPVSHEQQQLLLECQVLEKALEKNEERERAIDLEIKYWKDIQESTRIQLLAHKVRDSIARNQVREETPFSISNDPVIEKMDISVPSSIEQHVSTDSASLSKEKGKSRMDNVEVQQLSSQVNEPAKPGELCIQKRSPFLTAADQQLNARKSVKKTTGANASSKRPVNPDDTVQPLVPAVKRMREIAESSSKKKKTIQIEPSIEYGNPLVDALEESLESDSQSDSSVKETKRQRKTREEEEIISEEERKLVELDNPPYPGYCIHGRKELSRIAHRVVLKFLNYSSISLKEMRLMLLNLKEASIEQNGRLTIEQEVFTKVLIRKVMQMIESYMVLNDKAYAKSLLKKTRVDVSARLPHNFYGDLRKLDFSRPDLSHHQLYKVIRHFDTITNMHMKRKARQFLLSSGRMPTQPILRTCDPAIRDDADATLSGDETDYARRLKQPKAPREKRKATQELKVEMLAINQQVADEMTEDIDQMADQIATDMHLSKKTRLEPSTSVNKPVGLNIHLPESSSASRLEKLVNAWKPKPAPEVVSAQQFTSPSSSFTVVKPVHVAMKDISTNFTKDTSRAVDEAETKNYVSPIIDNTIASANPMQFRPYKSALNSLGLSRTTLLPEPKSTPLCSAESLGGVCKVKDCNFTHFRDYL